MKLIYELTIAERNFLENEKSCASKFIKAIHIVSSMCISQRSESDIMSYLDDFFSKDIRNADVYANFLKRIHL